MKSNILISLFIFFINTCFAQLSVDKPIEMTGIDPEQKQIKGVGNPTDSSDLINANTIIDNSLTYAISTGINTLILNLTPAIVSYNSGMVVEFKASSDNTGPVTLNINGVGQISVIDQNNEPLVANTIKNNQIITLAFDGTNFQIISRRDMGCPNGFVEVNSSFCIEINEHPKQPYLTAVSTCQSLNAKLCRWGEWYYACQKTSLGLSNMTNNYEYVDDTSDHSNTVLLVGSITCSGNTTVSLPQPQLSPSYYYFYRCCYRK